MDTGHQSTQTQKQRLRVAFRVRSRGSVANSGWRPERTLCYQGKEILEHLYRTQANGSYL